MPLVGCAAQCERIISVSLEAPNPVAVAAGYSVEYRFCPGCLRFWCGSCELGCDCGAVLETPRPAHALAIMLGAPVPNLSATLRLPTKEDA